MSSPETNAEQQHENSLSLEILNAFRNSQFFDALSAIRQELNERQSNYFNELIDPTELQKLEGTLKNLYDLLHGSDADQEEFTETIQHLKTRLDEIQPVRESAVRDDEDSLYRLVRALESVYNETETLERLVADTTTLSGEMKAPDLHMALQKLKPVLEEKIYIVKRRADNLASF